MRKIWWVMIALYAPWAGAVYKCVDEHGATLFGDTPPVGCGHVPIYELNGSGGVVKRIDPTPTPEEAKARQDEQERAKKAAAAAAEQQRQDMALMNSYTKAEEFDVARDRNVEPIQGRIQSARDRLKDLADNEKQLRATAESYRGKDGKGEAPAWIAANLERNAADQASLTKSIAQNEKEIAAVKLKFATDKKRWLALKGRPQDDPSPEPPPRKRVAN